MTAQNRKVGTMEYKYNVISEKSILAIYLILMASEARAERIYVSHQALKKYLNRDRIAESIIEKNLIKHIKHFFELCYSVQETSGTYLVVNLKKTKSPLEKSISVKSININEIPDTETMHKFIGGSVLTVSVSSSSI